MKLTAETYGFSNLSYLRENKLLPSSVESHYLNLAERIFKLSNDWLQTVSTQRLHGDCHIGNILWDVQSCSIVDFDDALEGPCVQDLWLLTPGRDALTDRYRELLLEGYEMMNPFDRSSLRLIEPLRALRMVHFTTWIARRFEDPAFKRTFVDYGSERYWREQLIALQEVGESLGIA
jgi:Ser/Thr protein kinase RdoA (MazF antagonist)